MVCMKLRKCQTFWGKLFFCEWTFVQHLGCACSLTITESALCFWTCVLARVRFCVCHVFLPFPSLLSRSMSVCVLLALLGSLSLTLSLSLHLFQAGLRN